MSLLKTNEIQNYNGSSLTLTASTVSTSAQLNTGGNISVTGSINVSDDSTTRTNLGLGTIATQNANSVAITGGTINTVQPATGQSLTIKDEDGNTAITIGTDNTAAGYLSLNFGSYHGDSGGAGSGTLTGNTLSDYEFGTWSPIYQPATGAFGSYTPDLEDGYYTKVGELVTCTFILRTDAITVGSASGQARLGGLPFTALSGYAKCVQISYSNNFAGEHPAGGYGSGANDFAILSYRTAADGSLNGSLNVTDLDTGANANYIIGSVIYYAD